MFYKNGRLMIRKVQEEDLLRLWELTRKEKDPEWKKWDAPYFEHHTMTYQEYVRNKDAVINRDDYWLIEVEGQVIGTVGYYWEHKPSKWLEMGIGIYDSNFWSGEFGTTALTLWINHLFNELAIVRVGYTTWSGNKQMVRVGEKLGMTMEARMRKCRYYNGEYYDSIRMGLLREEWEGWA